MIDGRHGGVFFPQDRTYVNTTDMARLIAAALGTRTWFSSSAGFAVRCMEPFVTKAKKAFGSLIYEDCEQFDFCYCRVNFENAVRGSV